ncbi:MAG: hypothetical protein ACYDIA_16135, partial [Candidatus Humimicrobiaceae bacterium]
LEEYFGHVSYDEMDSFVEKIKDKPYYIPGKEELLKRADDLYFKMPPLQSWYHDSPPFDPKVFCLD